MKKKIRWKEHKVNGDSEISRELRRRNGSWEFYFLVHVLGCGWPYMTALNLQSAEETIKLHSDETRTKQG